MNKYEVNKIIDVEITAIMPYGLFVFADNKYNGLIHISEINGKYIKNIENMYKVGDILQAKILEINEEKKQLKLTLINVKEQLKKQKNKKRRLVETKLGFDLFDEILPEWINEKLNEMKNNEKK